MDFRAALPGHSALWPCSLSVLPLDSYRPLLIRVMAIVIVRKTPNLSE